MNAKPFGRAVLPIVLAEIALSLGHSFFGGDSENSFLNWALMGVSFIVFPFWAGARVSRIKSSWYWWSVGGLCILVATLVSAAISEQFESSLAEMPLILVLGSIVVLVPIYALFGFLGGMVVLRSRASGA